MPSPPSSIPILTVHHIEIVSTQPPDHGHWHDDHTHHHLWLLLPLFFPKNHFLLQQPILSSLHFSNRSTHNSRTIHLWSSSLFPSHQQKRLKKTNKEREN
jgi:hypothetical protein